MYKLLRNSSPGALMREQAVALEKKRATERQRKVRQARELAAQGRGGNTEVAHVTPGEIVLSKALQTPEVMTAVAKVAAAHGVPLARLRVGDACSSINPRTGAPEFDFSDPFTSMSQPSASSGPAQTDAPNTNGGKCLHGSTVVPMMVTAYTSGPESTGKRPGDPAYGITASGTTAGAGTIAAPRNYAFGTRMYIPGHGWGTVEDRGGAIQGNALDVWFETVEEARRWGRQTLDVTVCKG